MIQKGIVNDKCQPYQIPVENQIGGDCMYVPYILNKLRKIQQFCSVCCMVVLVLCFLPASQYNLCDVIDRKILSWMRMGN